MLASVSVTLYISYLMLKERTTHVCIVQVSHAHPPLAAAVFNCYQMYSTSKSSPPCTCKGSIFVVLKVHYTCVQKCYPKLSCMKMK